MGLRADQLQRLKERFPGLALDESCTVVESWFGGDATLGKGASVVLSKIGAGTRVGEGSDLHGAEVGRGCVIGKECRIGAESDPMRVVSIGKGVTIGDHAIIHGGVRIGAGATIAAGTVVRADVAAVVESAGFTDGDPDDGLPLREFLWEKMPLVHVFNKWKAARGDETLRVEYSIKAGSVMVDVGGYHGDWAAEMVQRYGCVMHVFEPVHGFAEGIRVRFGSDGRVIVHEHGLGGFSRSEEISLASEGSSILKGSNTGAREKICVIAARDAFATLPEDIAVLKINIEGCEYELLDHLLDEKLMRRVRHLQVQFHDFVPQARERRREIRRRLRETHAERWNYPFIWEGWERLGAGG